MPQIINFSRLKGKKVLLLCHEHADLDSFCSAAIMRELLFAKKIPAVIGVPSHINDQALNFARQNKVPFELNPLLERFEEVFLFDLNGYEQLGSLSRKFKELHACSAINATVFDHHVIESTSICKDSNVICQKCLSTTELLFKLFNKNFNKKMFFYACIGLVEDTGRFLVGDESAFSVFAECLKHSGKKYADVLAFAKHQVPDAERIAFLKVAQRAQLIEIPSAKKGGKVLVVTSELSFYQAPAASLLLDFGADLALVAGKEKSGATTLSARADTTFKERRHFNLVNDLLKPLQARIGGEIGGHSGAAQWKGSAEPRNVLDSCVGLLKEALSK